MMLHVPRSHSPVTSARRILLATLGLTLALTLGLAGCALVGPDYSPPDITAPAAWQASLEGGLRTGPADPRDLAEWWRALNDPVLDSLMQRAVTGSLDLKAAKARVREARARRGVSEADLLPSVDGSASASHSTSSSETGTGTSRELYSAGLDASWELDIFGGVRRSVESAQAQLESAQAGLNDVLVSLMAEVALGYLDVRTYQARLAVAQGNLDIQQETYDLARSRYEAGLGDELAVQQALYNLESTRSQIPTLTAGLEAAANSLAAALGLKPGALNQELAPARPIPAAPDGVAVGVPAEALRRRPDVRQAERDLASATAEVGVATADLYPRFNLAGFIGLDALSLNRLVGGDAVSGQVSGGISLPIFRAGAIRQNIEIKSAQQEQALAAYEASVINALTEVENALAAYTRERVRRRSLETATRAAGQAAELAEAQYVAGLASFTTVLDTQRSLLSLQDQLAQSRGAITADLVRLYKALGGGWNSHAPAATPAAAAR